MKRTAAETCPHCGYANEITWDTDVNGFVGKCEECGKPLMLCDLCLHDAQTDKYIGGCDYCAETDSCKHNPLTKEVSL